MCLGNEDGEEGFRQVKCQYEDAITESVRDLCSIQFLTGEELSKQAMIQCAVDVCCLFTRSACNCSKKKSSAKYTLGLGLSTIVLEMYKKHPQMTVHGQDTFLMSGIGPSLSTQL